MSERLVITSKNGELLLRDLETFLRASQDYGLPITKLASYSVDDEGNLRISIALPKRIKVLAGGKRIIRVKGRNKKQRAIDKQLAEHRERKANGENEGYVPPVGRTKPAPVQKFKCAVCGVRKPVVTIARVKTIKPHTIKGEPCPGGGEQIGKNVKRKK